MFFLLLFLLLLFLLLLLLSFLDKKECYAASNRLANVWLITLSNVFILNQKYSKPCKTKMLFVSTAWRKIQGACKHSQTVKNSQQRRFEVYVKILFDLRELTQFWQFYYDIAWWPLYPTNFR